MNQRSKKLKELYMKSKYRLEGMREHQEGVIGVFHQSRNGKDVYISRMPSILGSKTKTFDHPLKACVHYNGTMLRLFGDDAVLCDPLALIRKYPVDGNAVS